MKFRMPLVDEAGMPVRHLLLSSVLISLLVATGVTAVASASGHRSAKRGSRPFVHRSAAKGRLIQPIAPEPDPVSRRCTRWADPAGDDRATGARKQPFRTAQKLVDSLNAGDIGCLNRGTYDQRILALRHSGTSGSGIVLRSTPGQRALVTGQIWVSEGANFVTVAHLDHDATFDESWPRPSPVINGDDSLFYDIDVWSDNGVCFYIGDQEWGLAHRTVLRRNHIHDCGQPGSNKRHGIYLAQGVDTLIEQNWIYDNPDRGIQFYPNATGTVVRGNVIDNNGEGIIFSGAYGWAASGNRVEGNYITNSHFRNDVESWYPDGNPLGVGNTVEGNCVYGGRFGTIDTSAGGFTERGNAITDPLYADAAVHDWRVRADSPCATLVLSGRQSVRKARLRQQRRADGKARKARRRAR